MNECQPKQIVKASIDVLREQNGNTGKSLAVKLELIDQLWNKLQRVVAWCLRLISTARGIKFQLHFY